MSRNILKPIFLFGLISLVFLGCKKLEFDKIASTSWNPNLAAPLAYADFNVYDILAKDDTTDLVVIDPNDGSLALVYNNMSYSISADEKVELQDVNQSESIGLGSLNLPPVPSFSGTVSSSNTQNVLLDAGSAEVHQITFASGTLSLNVSTDLQHDVTCLVTIPELIKNGSPVSFTIDMTYAGSVPQSASQSVDLTNAIGDFTNGNTSFNEIQIALQTTVTGTGQPINGNEEITVDYGMSNLTFESIEGYFGQNALGISQDTVLLKLFENASSGFFSFSNPKITFTAKNSFGFPVRLSFTELKATNVNNGVTTLLNGYPSNFDIAAPSNIGQTEISTFELNTNNTNNLSSMITSVPKYFIFSGTAQSNPNGNVPPLNFMTDQSELVVETEVVLPLEGYAYGFELKDTVDFNFNEDVSQLESVMFRLNADNGFPVELAAQVVFLDQNYTPLFTAFNSSETVIPSALVDNTGKVNEHMKKTTDISLSQAQIAQLDNVKYILINAVTETLEGASGQIVKFYDDYTLDLNLGVQVEGKVQL